MPEVQVQLLAGSVSTLLFATSNLPMLLKVYKTRDMRSYSFGYIAMNNVGNIFHWFYVLSLPMGPIWLLHSFFTVSSLLLLVGYLRYERLKVHAHAEKQLQNSIIADLRSGQLTWNQEWMGPFVPPETEESIENRTRR